jgi:hypothetical protein
MSEQIGIGIAVAVVVGIIGWLYKLAIFKKDEATIVTFLESSKRDTNHTFRSSEAIAAHTNLTIERISTVCSKSRKIRRNGKEKESWCLQQEENA